LRTRAECAALLTDSEPHQLVASPIALALADAPLDGDGLDGVIIESFYVSWQWSSSRECSHLGPALCIVTLTNVCCGVDINRFRLTMQKTTAASLRHR
jgi:hypothetical protein